MPDMPPNVSDEAFPRVDGGFCGCLASHRLFSNARRICLSASDGEPALNENLMIEVEGDTERVLTVVEWTFSDAGDELEGESRFVEHTSHRVESGGFKNVQAGQAICRLLIFL